MKIYKSTVATLSKEIEILQHHSNFLNESEISEAIRKTIEASDTVGSSSSGSWLGYQSLIYHLNFTPPKKGSHFSQEYGLKETYSDNATTGDWEEYTYEEVLEEINARSKIGTIEEIEKLASEANEAFHKSKSRAISALSIFNSKMDDTYVKNIFNEIEKSKIYTADDFVSALKPTGNFFTRDNKALQGGIRPPPHIAKTAYVSSLRHTFASCKALSDLIESAKNHIEIITMEEHKNEKQTKTKVFIGHGRSVAWRDLKDFIQDRMHLPWDEFNRVPIAGLSNTARLTQMLDEAAIAFLVMTAEDELADGSHLARQNVIHEAGLFQGRLGFERAIILLEEGCTEFSNIQGLGQIRFPKNNIKAAFEDIRSVLEREGIASP